LKLNLFLKYAKNPVTVTVIVTRLGGKIIQKYSTQKNYKKRKAHLVREGEVGGLGRKGKSFLLEGGNSFPSTEEEKHIRFTSLTGKSCRI
jgi:hypothetical protein